MQQSVETILPYGSDGSQSKARQVEAMFDSIAPAYDFMNRAMTLGIDRWWRRVAVKRVAKQQPQAILDVATGTGDFAISLLQNTEACTVTGIDLSEGMLDVARRKVQKLGLDGKLILQKGDCLELPFDDGAFDAVTVAFGVRNFSSLEKGYAEMLRVLRPGGLVCVLELSTPKQRLMRWFYDFYTLRIIPFFGALKSGDKEAYRYLPKSIAAVPQRQQMTELMSQAGFENAQFKTLTMGTCTIYTAQKRNL